MLFLSSFLSEHFHTTLPNVLISSHTLTLSLALPLENAVMEHRLRCNSLKCRRELCDRALVTTCSHIFCTDCATRLGLVSQRHDRNSCPACGTHLANPDDAVIANLNPSEDYKTSVLSGLSPNVVIECASRALSFWAYQSTQEMYSAAASLIAMHAD
jgi:hypothetical protein